jgi:hypothetical protein
VSCALYPHSSAVISPSIVYPWPSSTTLTIHVQDGIMTATHTTPPNTHIASIDHVHSSITSLETLPTVDIAIVSPEMADVWLKNKAVNRTVKQGRVDQYARDMVAGEWKLTGEPVKFDMSQKLIDGQHRLLAIIKADTSVALFVARNLPDDVQPYLDSGTARTAADELSMRGESDPMILAASARLGCIVDNDWLYGGRKKGVVSKVEIYRWIEKHPEIRQSVFFVRHGNSLKAPLPPSVKCYSHFRFAAVDQDAADDFFDSLGGLRFEPGSPIHALSSRIYQANVKRRKVEQIDWLSVLFRVWNAHRQGRELKMVQLKSPKIKPELPELV